MQRRRPRLRDTPFLMISPQIQETTAVLSAKVDNPAAVQCDAGGMLSVDANDTLLTRHVENCQRPESRFNMWYDVQGELGIPLYAGNDLQISVLCDPGGGRSFPELWKRSPTAGTAPDTGAAQASGEGGPVIHGGDGQYCGFRR